MADLTGQTVTTTNGNTVTYGPDGKPRMNVAPDGTTQYYDALGNEISNPAEIKATQAAINSQPNYNVPPTPTNNPAGPQPANPPTNVAALVEAGQTPQTALLSSTENSQLTTAQQLSARAQATEQNAIVKLTEAQIQLDKLKPDTEAYDRAQQSVALLREQAELAETQVQAAKENLKIEATLAQDAGRITTVTPSQQPPNLDRFNVVSSNKISVAAQVEAGLDPETAVASVQALAIDDPFAQENASPEPLARTITVPGDYSVVPNNNGSFDVVETQTGVTVASGLDRDEASVFAYEQSQIDTGVEIPNPDAEEVPNQLSGPTDVEDPLALYASQELDVTGSLAESLTAPNPYRERQAYDEDGNLNPGFTLDEDNNPVFVGYDFVEPATQASSDQSRAVAAGVANAKKQQTILTQQRTLNNLDWRVRLSLADNSNYLYNVASSAENILDPLKSSNGVIFPYTPQIATNYKANYSNYDLTHSNYRGYFYQNSYTDNITITATFTAQNTEEANYLLAVIHFFRSVTKMFYGQSQNLGSPPPMCFLTGLGDYQFNKHPVLVTNFSYNLPNDVDYIRAGSANNLQLNQNQLRNKQVETTNNSLRSVMRLANALLPSGKSVPKGATAQVPTSNAPNTKNPTYVPTKMDIVITLLPVQSRQRVSQVFNLQEFANGNQLKGGFW
jgi:hypothetical protein